ncbi:MAG: glycosyltransferase, partial [Methanosphaera sp.]|nr:glycosyltransferase [Methanosphaera sp.]
KEMFENCDAFVTTSQSAYDLYTEFYPELKDKLFSIIEHGRDIQTPNSVINLPEFKDDESIRIVFPGHINANKGAALIKDIKKYDKNNLLEFHYMGNLNPKYKLDEIGIHHGYYKRSEFCKEIHEIKPHFIGLLSIWPETYCHTLTEGWSCGIPVISLDIGALGERIHKNGGGFFIENDGKKAYDKIIEISKNYEKYKEVINGIPSIKFKTTKEMTEEYIRLYEKYVDLD